MYLYAKSQIELHGGRTELSNVLERIIREGSFEKDYSRRMRIRKIKDHNNKIAMLRALVAESMS